MNTIKIRRKAVCLCLIALSLTILPPSFNRASLASPAVTAANMAQNDALDFTLVNGTGYGIKRVYIGPSNTPNWTEDMEVLQGRAFKNGTALDITFSPKAKSSKWDLRVEWSDGDAPVDWYGLDLITIEKLTLLYDADTGKTSVRIN
jgi:hypothetical protein